MVLMSSGFEQHGALLPLAVWRIRRRPGVAASERPPPRRLARPPGRLWRSWASTAKLALLAPLALLACHGWRHPVPQVAFHLPRFSAGSGPWVGSSLGQRSTGAGASGCSRRTGRCELRPSTATADESPLLGLPCFRHQPVGSGSNGELLERWDTERITGLLESLPVFTRLPLEVLQKLAAKMQWSPYQDGAFVARQGDGRNQMFILVAGEVHAFRTSKESGEREIVKRYTKQGAYFGEIAHLDDLPAEATLRASGPTALLALSGKDFDAEVSKDFDTDRLKADIAMSDTMLGHVCKYYFTTMAMFVLLTNIVEWTIPKNDGRYIHLVHHIRSLLLSADPIVSLGFLFDWWHHRAERKLQRGKRLTLDCFKLMACIPMAVVGKLLNLGPVSAASFAHGHRLKLWQTRQLFRMWRAGELLYSYALQGSLNSVGVVVSLASVVTWVLGSTTVFIFEEETSSLINTPADALWWCAATITTCGYGDVTPVTQGGRIVAFIVMIVGISLYGAVSGTIASMVLERSRRLAHTRGETSMEVQELIAEVKALRSTVEDLSQRLPPMPAPASSAAAVAGTKAVTPPREGGAAVV